MRRFKAIILSWDFGITLLSVFTTYLVLPEYINMNFALSFYNVAMTVLSIIFSLFFTAMAIIMSSSDNDFIEFLEEKNTFTELLWSFKFTLFVLFLSLILSILLYSGTSYWIETNHNETWLQDYRLLLLLQFCFLYGMIATWFSIIDTVKFSQFRSEFLKEQKIKKQKKEE
ncbi:hypothetical protein [Flavobacterium sp. WC2429]|jgi:hypothetical protein|uniref:Uncharacterized protein n=1 Tax=Flavobacterium sp. WC2429 TaxID=3234140 RepID=A0AB39WKQ4_9FLAO